MAHTNALVIGLVLLLAFVEASSPTPTRHPVILFPAYALSSLLVEVKDQKFAPDCPPNGKFTVRWPDFVKSLPNGWTDECATKMLRLRVDVSKQRKPKFRNMVGVTTTLPYFGDTTCAPYYQPVFEHLQKAAGYAPGKDLAVACYDFRFTPSTSIEKQPTNLEQATKLLKAVYKRSGNKPVYLLGHSNGPLYAKALLDSLSPSQKRKYIAGFLPFAGNWPGQGLLAAVLFSGLSVNDFSFQPSTAAVYEGFPSTYMSSARPQVFGRKITIVKDSVNSYTPKDYSKLFKAAGLHLAAKLHPLYNTEVSIKAPGVQVHSVYGSGLETVVGAVYNVTVDKAKGTPPTDVFTRDGDGNQEDITNESNFVWKEEDKCHEFSTVHVIGDPKKYPTAEDPALHFNLPLQIITNPKLLQILQAPLPKPKC